MNSTQYTLTVPGLSHDEAFEVMEKIETKIGEGLLVVTINETDEARGFWETLAWFESEETARLASFALNFETAIIAAIVQKDWVRESLQGLAPVVAGRFFLHGSHDRDQRRIGGVSLEVDAGTAFGTGHHGTTWGCLLAFDAIIKKQKPKRILDLGTGTGVLALAAAKALGQKVLGTDIDGEAVRVAAMNARNNGNGPRFIGAKAAGLHSVAVRQHAPFDLIFANILARPLSKLAQGLSQILLPGGHLILSGLTHDQERWIKALYTARGLTFTRVIHSSNWVTLVLTKPLQNEKSRREKSLRHYDTSRGSGYAETV